MRGFSLIEVLVALTLLSFVTSAVLTLQLRSLRQAQQIAMQTFAVEIAASIADTFFAEHAEPLRQYYRYRLQSTLPDADIDIRQLSHSQKVDIHWQPVGESRQHVDIRTVRNEA